MCCPCTVEPDVAALTVTVCTVLYCTCSAGLQVHQVQMLPASRKAAESRCSSPRFKNQCGILADSIGLGVVPVSGCSLQRTGASWCSAPRTQFLRRCGRYLWPLIVNAGSKACAAETL
jgi:hypothetical protein